MINKKFELNTITYTINFDKNPVMNYERKTLMINYIITGAVINNKLHEGYVDLEDLIKHETEEVEKIIKEFKIKKI